MFVLKILEREKEARLKFSQESVINTTVLKYSI